MQIGSGTKDVKVEVIVGDVEDHSLREELRSCQHFLVVSENEGPKHKAFNHAVEVQRTIVNEKRSFEICSKSESGFGFILRNIKDGGFRYV